MPCSARDPNTIANRAHVCWRGIGTGTGSVSPAMTHSHSAHLAQTRGHRPTSFEHSWRRRRLRLLCLGECCPQPPTASHSPPLRHRRMWTRGRPRHPRSHGAAAPGGAATNHPRTRGKWHLPSPSRPSRRDIVGHTRRGGLNRWRCKVPRWGLQPPWLAVGELGPSDGQYHTSVPTTLTWPSPRTRRRKLRGWGGRGQRSIWTTSKRPSTSSAKRRARTRS
mmetsp:Transcript_772/g.2562  ORF Transcript_772/g.2562 Transcript_772/m.2562 type:complete len:221 (+) Transcript_772:429-1091(+)